MALPDKWKWFADGRFGTFIHWGPYAANARGEQVLFREQFDPTDYARATYAWNPRAFDDRQWAQIDEFVTRGYQTARDDQLYLILRCWHGGDELRMADRVASLSCTIG